MLGADIAVDHDRAHPVGGLPVRRRAPGRQRQHPRGQAVDAHAGQKQKAVVVDQKREVRNPRVGRPANEVVARPLMPTRGAKPDAAEAAV